MYYFTIHNLSSFSLNMNDIVLQESQVLLILMHTKYSNQTWMTLTSNVACNVELTCRWCIAPKHFFTYSKFLKYRYNFCTIIQLEIHPQTLPMSESIFLRIENPHLPSASIDKNIRIAGPKLVPLIPSVLIVVWSWNKVTQCCCFVPNAVIF